MPMEIEAKYKVASFAPIEKALKKAGATFLGTNHQRDQFFDTHDHALRRADKGLRLRTIKAVKPANHKGCSQATEPILTFKGPGDKTKSLKIRMEIQTCVNDAWAITEILKHLGFSPDIVVCKKRSSYALDNCQVELDQLPRIGRFIEVEGPSQKAVQTMCRQLGLTGKPITTPYVAMVAKLNHVQQ